MKITLLYTVKLSASHHLPGYDGACAVDHGHTYFVDLEIAGPIDETSGMIVDYNELERRCNTVFPNKNHLCFNDFMSLPTAENIAPFLFEHYDTALFGTSCRLISLILWEDRHDGQGVKVCA